MSYENGYRDGFTDGYQSALRRQFDKPDLHPALHFQDVRPKPKQKRKATAYQKRYATAYRKLKRQHPRLTFGSISKKAHKVARQ